MNVAALASQSGSQSPSGSIALSGSQQLDGESSYSGSSVLSRSHNLSQTQHSNSLTSLLAASDEEETKSSRDNEVTSVADEQKAKDEAIYGGLLQRSQLTKLQEEISYAVDTINTHYFVDLGGVFYYDINFVGRQGFPLKIASMKGSENFVRLMLENKMIDINKQDEHGLNSFWIAAKHGHGDIMRVLAEHGIEIYNTDKKGNNALHLSARYANRFNICEMLVKSHYDLNIDNDDGDTAAHIAAQKGNLPQLQALVDQGADVNILNNQSLSPLYLAILNEQQDCVDILLENGGKAFYDGSDREKDRSPIFLAIRNQQKDILTSIFDQVDGEEQMAIKNSQGLSPSMFAAKNNYHEALNVLVLLDSNSINEEDKNAMTILMHVMLAEEFKPKLAKRLIKRGADINYIDRNGNPLLIKLVQLKQTKLVQFLLEQRGTLQHLVDEENKCACDYAKDNGLANELPQFMDCSLRKKKIDMSEIEKRMHDKSSKMGGSFKRIAAGSSFKKRQGSIVQRISSNGSGVNNDSIDEHFKKLADEYASSNERVGKVVQASAPQVVQEQQPQQIQQKVITKVVHKPDLQMQEELKSTIIEMENRQKATIQAMMQQMQEQQAQREKEIHLVLEEKNRQIELIKQTESQKSMISTQLKQIFLEERTSQNQEMQDFLKTFKDQRDATADRLQNLPQQYREELQEQQEEAKRIFNDQEMRQTFTQLKLQPDQPEINSQAEVDLMNATALVKAQGDMVKASNKQQLLTELQPMQEQTAEFKEAVVAQSHQQIHQSQGPYEKIARESSQMQDQDYQLVSSQQSLRSRKSTLQPLQDAPQPPSDNISERSYSQQILEKVQVPNKKVLAPIQNAPLLSEDVSEDEAPNYLDLVMVYNEQRKQQMQANIKAAKANPVPSAYIPVQPKQVSAQDYQKWAKGQKQQPQMQQPTQKASANLVQQPAKSMKVIANPDTVGIDLEDSSKGLPQDAFKPIVNSRQSNLAQQAAAAAYSINPAKGGELLPQTRIRKVTKKKKKKGGKPAEAVQAPATLGDDSNEPVIFGLAEVRAMKAEQEKLTVGKNGKGSRGVSPRGRVGAQRR